MTWRTATPCRDCPFDKSPGGVRQRRALRPARWRQILRDLLAGAHFTCHKTTRETGNGTELLCAGALAWQEARGVSSNLQRCMEALDYFAAERAKRSATVQSASRTAAAAPSTGGQGVTPGTAPALPVTRRPIGGRRKPGGPTWRT